MSPDDLDDAVASAMVDLVDYWLTLNSSVTEDTSRNFKFAVWRATREASKFLVSTFDTHEREVSYDGDVDSDGNVETRYGFVLIDERPGPEEQVCEAEEIGLAQQLLTEMGATEMDSWLRDYLEGITEEEHARRVQVSQQSLHRRRTRGRRRLCRAAIKVGLVLDLG